MFSNFGGGGGSGGSGLPGGTGLVEVVAGAGAVLTPAQSLAFLGVPPTWQGTEMVTAQALLPGAGINSSWWFDAAYGGVSPVAAGLSLGASSDNNLGTVDFTTTPGAATLSTTATATRYAGVQSFGRAPFIAAPNGGVKFYASWFAKPLASLNNTTKYGLYGAYDSTNLSGFQFDGSVDTTKWYVIGNRGGTAFNTPGTGAGATLDATAYHRLAVASDGTTMTCYVDRVAIGSGPASALPANPSWPMAFVFNGATSANRQIAIAQWFFAWAF